jgi:glutaredoxin
MSDKESLPSITVISKRGCHLCEQAIDILNSIRSVNAFHLSILFVEDDPNLFDKYWIRVPVVRLNGDDVFEAQDLANGEVCKSRLKALVASRHASSAFSPL